MALGDLKKNLYKNQQSKRAHGKTEYHLETSRARESGLGDESPWKIKERGGLERIWRAPLLKIAVIFAVIILLSFSAWTFITIRSNLFDAQDVEFTVEGPTSVASGMSAVYTVRYTNNNSVTLKDAVLIIEHTPAFKIATDSDLRYDGLSESSLIIGEIKPRQTKEIVVRGRFEDSANGAMYIKPRLSFVPATTGKRVVREQRLGLMQDRNALHLTVNAQRSVSDNSVIEYVVQYTNDAAQSYEDVALEVQFPTGFTLRTVKPETVSQDVGKDIWSLGTIAPNTEATVQFRGTLSGVLDDVKLAIFTISMQDGQERAILAQEEWTTHIAPSTLTIKQLVNNQSTYVAHAGEGLRYSLIYKNTSDLGMRDVVVRLKFDDRILDYARLELSASGGSLDAQTRSVVWRASDIPGLTLLSPGQSGRIDLAIPVRTNISVRDDNDRNLMISTTAEIDSPDVPTPIGENKIISSNTTLLKLVSPINFNTEGFYDDFTIKNTGPIPPLLNEKTTFTIRWTLSNATNALARAKVEAYLPTSVAWEGVTFPETETIQFNPRTHKIVWNIGDVKNGVGIFRKKREVRFQVSVTPTIDQVGDAVPLLKESTFSAQDTFTETPVTVLANAKTTALSEDPAIKSGVVQK